MKCGGVCSEALERQRQMYERQMQLLRSQLMSPSTPSLPYSFEAFTKMTPTGAAPSSLHPRYQQWAHDRFVTVISHAHDSPPPRAALAPHLLPLLQDRLHLLLVNMHPQLSVISCLLHAVIVSCVVVVRCILVVCCQLCRGGQLYRGCQLCSGGQLCRDGQLCHGGQLCDGGQLCGGGQLCDSGQLFHSGQLCAVFVVERSCSVRVWRS